MHITVIFHFEKNEITNDQFKENIFHSGLDLSVPRVLLKNCEFPITLSFNNIRSEVKFVVC